MEKSTSLYSDSDNNQTPVSPLHPSYLLKNVNTKPHNEPPKKLHISGTQIILLSFIFTVFQNISLSKLPKTSYFVIPVVVSTTVGYYFIQHLPISSNFFKMKIRLILTKLYSLTQGVKFDLWLTIIIILLSSWILSIWKASISFVIWCFIIWVYNLDETSSSNSIDSLNPESSYLYKTGDDQNLLTGMSSFDKDSMLNSGIHDSSSYNRCCSASLGYINTLEKKVNQLSKRISILEDDKLEQNIIIYTFNHNLNDKIGSLEKKIHENEQSRKKDLSQIYNVIFSLKQRKRIRINILKMYIKQFLLWVLPELTVLILKRVKAAITVNIMRLRGIFHL